MSHIIVGFLKLLAIAFYFCGAGVFFYVARKVTRGSNLKEITALHPMGALLFAGGFLCETIVKNDINGRLEVGLIALLWLIYVGFATWLPKLSHRHTKLNSSPKDVQNAGQ